MNTPFKQSNISNKTLSILLGVLILMSVGMLVWSLDEVKENVMNRTNKSVVETQEQKKEDMIEVDTSNWLTYRNEEYGFEFRYPRGWEVKEYDNSVGLKKDPDNFESFDISFSIINTLDTIIDYDRAKTFDDTLKKRFYESIKIEDKILSRKKVTIISQYNEFLNTILTSSCFTLKKNYLCVTTLASDSIFLRSINPDDSIHRQESIMIAKSLIFIH